MKQLHARDLDLNLFRVLVAVADTGSVTAAAAQLYLTQSAVSAALGRLKSALGTPVVARHGRGIVLTERAARVVADVRPHLESMINLALAPSQFFGPEPWTPTKHAGSFGRRCSRSLAA